MEPLTPVTPDQFWQVYDQKLHEAFEKHPDKYCTHIPASEVARRMRHHVDTIGVRAVNIDSPAWKAACRALKIPHNRTSLSALLDPKKGE